MRGGRRLLVLATTAGIVLAGVVTLLQDSIYRADASIVLVREGQPPGSDPKLAAAAAASAELFDSRAVAESAIRNLGLAASPGELLDRVTVDPAEGSSLVRIEVEAPTGEEARRTAQEVSEVATVLFNDRFAPQTVASVWEPASAGAGRVSPKPARNLALGALLGALAGSAFVAFGRRPARPPSLPRPKFARKRASAPAPTELVAAIHPPPRTEPAPEPAPDPGPPPVVEAGSGWTVAAVERLLAEHGDAFPDRGDEFRIYVDSFRDVAGPDGALPPGVTVVVEDVFADLIERQRRR